MSILCEESINNNEGRYQFKLKLEDLKDIETCLAKSKPVSMNETLKNPKWISEMRSIENNKTWSLVELPRGNKAIGVKWVYRVKMNP